MQATPQKNLNPGLICLALVVLTITAFWQLKDCGFINFDDNIYVYENTYVQSGLNWNGIVQAFSFELPKTIGHWHPLTWLSLMLDYSLFGLNPSGYHLVNLLFHIGNSILLFLILRRMTKALWPSAFVGALFAIHPLHVESVAWIVERKDVLSTFFWMLTLGAYSFYVEKRNIRRYALVLLFFALGLLSKPMLVTLPFALLLLDYWPLGRFSERKPEQKIQTEDLKPVTLDKPKKKSKKKDSEKEEAKQTLIVRKPVKPGFQWSLIYPLLLEKAPLFALTILSSIATYVAADSAGAVHSEAIPLVVRVGNTFVSYIAYIGKMILPINLAVLYPHPGSVVLWQVFGAAVLLFAITFVVIWKVKKFPYMATGWLWYMGTLVPVIGIVQAGSQAMADRYTYIPLIGLFIMLAWGVPDLLKKVNYRREILWTASLLCILCLSILTWKQVGYWQNSISLFDHTLKITEKNYRAYNIRGVAYADLSNYRQAIADYSRAIEIEPGYPDAYYNRGKDYASLGKYIQAIEDFSRAIAIRPDYALAYNNRGNAYVDHGNLRQAIEDYGKAIEIKPDYSEAYFNRGNAHVYLGNYRQAIEDYSRAVEIKAGYTEAYKNRGIAHAKYGNNNRAVNDLKTAAQLGDESTKKYLRSQGISW